MKIEKDIIYQNGSHWLCKHKTHHLIMRDNNTHALEISKTSLGLENAIEMCDYFARQIIRKKK